MLWWLKSEQVRQHQELSHRLGRNPSTITRWLGKYRQGGLSALLEVLTSPGRPCEFDGEMLERLQNRLEQPEGFTSYGQIQQWLEQEEGKQVLYKTVYKTVRYRLKAKLKVPRPCSLEQDEQGVELF